MDFSLTDEQALLRKSVREFAEAEIRPHVMEWDEAQRFPKALFPKLADLGLMGIQFPEAYGGAGMSAVDYCICIEEIARVCPSVSLSVAAHNGLGAAHIAMFGTEEQKRKYLVPLAKGEKLAAWGLTEPGSGSDAAAMRTTAARDGECWVLNGSKMFITNGVHGDLYFVAAKTGEPGRNRQITMFAVEKGTPGFAVARPLHKTGWLASDTAELVFDGCRVPDANRIGDEGKGFYALVNNLQNERMVLAAQSMGEAAKAIELTLQWVTQRRAFGATLWDKQAVRHKLSARAGEVEAVRALLYTAAWRASQGADIVKEASMLKALAGTLVNEVMYDCVQLHGGMGYMRESAIERMSRDARVQAIGGGATEVMLEEAAKRY
jgi:acyl-CoA dehydrogenase